MYPALITQKNYQINSVAIPESIKTFREAKHNAIHNKTPHCNHITHCVRVNNHSAGKNSTYTIYNCMYHSRGLEGNEAEVLELE
jgi:hypothetical protein